MRVFNNESMWDAENQKWYELYTIDGYQVSEDVYSEQLEVEEMIADEDMELEEESEDYTDYEIPCQCDTCRENRGEFDEEFEYEDEEICFCEECNEPREKELIDQCMEVVFSGCPNCAIEAIIDTLYKFKEIGKLEMKQDMKDFMED